ncbi:hypothetical protein BDN67DRAFT_978792 [Paxillus ammoniavirescens]|nr:hypothetical protein BDN67DRAFT_978792 [Paxillus ammoniavirescens]
MPKTTVYVWCSCESFHCRDNLDGTGHKLQTTQTAAQHRTTDEQLVSVNYEAVAAQQLSDHWPASPQANAEDFDTGPNSYGDLSGDENDEEELDIDGDVADGEPAQEVDDPPDEADAQDVNDLFTHGRMSTFTQPHPHAYKTTQQSYIWAYVSAVFYNATHAAVYHDLEGKERLLHTAQAANPDIEYPGLDSFARTLPTLLKHLGLSNGSVKCTPTKLVPYVPPEQVLQCFFLRPGKWDQFQCWCGAQDQPSAAQPIPGRGYGSFPDPDKPLMDIYDGWG